MPVSRLSEEDWVPISALQHYAYCPRQCALIHVSQIFDENVYTLRGSSVHDRAHESGRDVRRGVRVERSLPIWSARHGITGKADVVEFRDETVRPVEYKAGRLRNPQGRAADRVQLCAQALCLEEMLGTAVAQGDLYYARSRTRTTVEIARPLREKTLRIVEKVRRQITEADLPEPVNDARCADCSLNEGCMPATDDLSADRLDAYLRSMTGDEGRP